MSAAELDGMKRTVVSERQLSSVRRGVLRVYNQYSINHAEMCLERAQCCVGHFVQRPKRCIEVCAMSQSGRTTRQMA